MEFQAFVNSLIEQVCDEFENPWRDGRRESIESALEQSAGDDRKALLYELICLEIGLLTAKGETPQPSDYHVRFPEDKAIIGAAFEATVSLHLESTDPRATLDPFVTNLLAVQQPASTARATVRNQSVGPPRIGRYTVLARLGSGG